MSISKGKGMQRPATQGHTFGGDTGACEMTMGLPSGGTRCDATRRDEGGGGGGGSYQRALMARVADADADVGQGGGVECAAALHECMHGARRGRAGQGRWRVRDWWGAGGHHGAVEMCPQAQLLKD